MLVEVYINIQDNLKTIIRSCSASLTNIQMTCRKLRPCEEENKLSKMIFTLVGHFYFRNALCKLILTLTTFSIYFLYLTITNTTPLKLGGSNSANRERMFSNQASTLSVAKQKSMYCSKNR